MMYHGYENGYWTLGRQALLEPVRWGADGWPVPLGGDLSRPLLKPRSPKPQPLKDQPHGHRLSDDFSSDRMGTLWSFYDPGANEAARCFRRAGVLRMQGKGKTPSDCSPLTCIAGDQAYRITVDVEATGGAEGGLLCFYNRRLYAGLGLGGQGLVMHRYGLRRPRGAANVQRGSGGSVVSRLSLRLTNDRNILTILTSNDGRKSWQKFDVQMELSGYHHNVAYDFLSLRPALYAAGSGEVAFRNFTYEAL